MAEKIALFRSRGDYQLFRSQRDYQQCVGHCILITMSVTFTRLIIVSMCCIFLLFGPRSKLVLTILFG